MKIALIWPYGFETSYVLPLPFGYLKSNLDTTKHELKIIDCSLQKLKATSPEFRRQLEEFNPDLVGVSCWSPTYEEALRTLKVAKSLNKKLNKNIVTVMGGAHATSYSDKIFENKEVDFIFRGEAELSFPRFIEELQRETEKAENREEQGEKGREEESGKIRILEDGTRGRREEGKMRRREDEKEGNPDWPAIKGLVFRTATGITKNAMERENNLDLINFPDYDAMNFEEYLRQGYRFNTVYRQNAPVWVTRGCPYRCNFCSASLLNGKLIRKHSVDYVVKWVKYLYEQKSIRMINIIDDNFTFHIDYAKEFCRAMIDLNLNDLHFGTPNGIRIQKTDTELFGLMKMAGWENLIVAPESGSEKVLKKMQKDLNLSLVPQKIKEIKTAGLKAHGFFIIGYPGETREDLRETVKLLRKCRFNFFFLNNFQPLPGTPIYDELVLKGEIPEGLLPKNYSGGERVYVPEDLKEVNFAKLVLREYFLLALTNPINIPYLFKLISPKMAAKKVLSNLKNMVWPGSFSGRE